MTLLEVSAYYLPGCMAAACTAGIAPTEAAYSSPHVQSELVTDHLHFGKRHCRQSGNVIRGLAQPTRGNFEGDCRSGLRSDSRRCWDAGLSMGGAKNPPALYCPPPGSFPRQRLAGNTWRVTRSASATRPPDPSLSLRAGHENHTRHRRKRSTPAAKFSTTWGPARIGTTRPARRASVQ